MESIASMSATESKEDFLTFRGLLNLMECLLDVRGKFFGSDYQVEKPIEEVIIYTAKRLTDLDVNTSESNAFEELERLATMEQNILSQYRDRGCGYEKLRDRDIFHSVIDSKIDFIKKGSFSRLASGGGVGQLGALERLAEVKKKLWRSESMSELLISKTKEVVYTLEPKASLRNDPVMR